MILGSQGALLQVLISLSFPYYSKIIKIEKNLGGIFIFSVEFLKPAFYPSLRFDQPLGRFFQQSRK